LTARSPNNSGDLGISIHSSREQCSNARPSTNRTLHGDSNSTFRIVSQHKSDPTDTLSIWGSIVTRSYCSKWRINEVPSQFAKKGVATQKWRFPSATSESRKSHSELMQIHPSKRAFPSKLIHKLTLGYTSHCSGRISIVCRPLQFRRGPA
jgi:hypothetical protein